MDYFLIALGAGLLFVSVALVVAVPLLSLVSRRAMRRAAEPFAEAGFPDVVETMTANPLITEMERLRRPMKAVNVGLILVTGALGVSLLGTGTDRPTLALSAPAVCAAGVLMTVLGYRRHVEVVTRFGEEHGDDADVVMWEDGSSIGGTALSRSVTPLD